MILRPEDLATDFSPTDAVLEHALETLARAVAVPDSGMVLPEYTVLLQPTTPIRPPGLIDGCIEMAIENEADSLLTVHRLHFVWHLDSQGRPRHNAERRPSRQAMTEKERRWAENGAVYVTRTEVLRETGKRITGKVQMFETEPLPDIDTEEDWRIAEALMLNREGRT